MHMSSSSPSTHNDHIYVYCYTHANTHAHTHTHTHTHTHKHKHTYRRTQTHQTCQSFCLVYSLCSLVFCSCFPPIPPSSPHPATLSFIILLFFFPFKERVSCPETGSFFSPLGLRDFFPLFSHCLSALSPSHSHIADGLNVESEVW